VKISNVHGRALPLPALRVAPLIDSLASPEDRLWPTSLWPAMRLDAPLGVGARGGHGPVRYAVDAHAPGHRVSFRIERPPCLKGARHGFEVIATAADSCVLRHVLELEFSGRAWLSWPLVWRPLHDACIEDALAGAQLALGLPPLIRPWSRWVRLLRFLISGGRAPRQRFSDSAKGEVS